MYIHNSLCLLSHVESGYKEGPLAKRDQISLDGQVAALVDEVVEVSSLCDLPRILLPTKELELKSDEYLESIRVENLEMDDIEL